MDYLSWILEKRRGLSGRHILLSVFFSKICENTHQFLVGRGPPGAKPYCSRAAAALQVVSA